MKKFLSKGLNRANACRFSPARFFFLLSFFFSFPLFFFFPTGSPFSFLIPSAHSRPRIYSAFIDRFLSRRGLERTALPCSSVIPIPRSCLPGNHGTGFLSMEELGRPAASSLSLSLPLSFSLSSFLSYLLAHCVTTDCFPSNL